RVYPQLMGVVPQNAGGFGSISDAAAVWASLELEPMQARLLQINDLLGEEIIQFRRIELA
ncbi:TPA: Presumed portal vertex protein, partial [Pseudomonas aeruginosa]